MGGALIGPILGLAGSVLSAAMAPSAPSPPSLPPAPKPVPVPAAPPAPIAEPIKQPEGALDLAAAKQRDLKRQASAQNTGITLLNADSGNPKGQGKTLLGQ